MQIVLFSILCCLASSKLRSLSQEISDIRKGLVDKSLIGSWHLSE